MSTPSSLLILAGGENVRMGPLRSSIYKAFLPIHGASMVARHVLRAHLSGILDVTISVDAIDPLLESLARPQNVDELSCEFKVVECAGSPGDKIRAWAAHHNTPGPHLVIAGDTFAPIDLSDFWTYTVDSKFDSGIAVARVNLPFGVVITNHRAVTHFDNTPQLPVTVNTGHMVLGDRAIELFRSGSDLGPALATLAAEGELAAYECSQPVVAVDSLGSLAVAHATLLDSSYHPTPSSRRKI